MPAPISALEHSSYPSMAAAGEQGIAVEACPDRRQEFESMLPQSLPRFRRMAMRWLRNPEDAEDAVQEAMLSAFKNIERFDGRAQMSTWLTAIVINAVRMQIRRRPRGHMLPLDHSGERGQSALSEILADPRPTAQQTLEQRELSELVTKLTGALSLSQQAALRLRLQDDLSIQETAETLGVPQGTVKSQLARGRAILTERFNAATAKPKNSDPVRSSQVRSEIFPEYRCDPVQDITHPPINVFIAQGGSEVWVGA